MTRLFKMPLKPITNYNCLSQLDITRQSPPLLLESSQTNFQRQYAHLAACEPAPFHRKLGYFTHSQKKPQPLAAHLRNDHSFILKQEEEQPQLCPRDPYQMATPAFVSRKESLSQVTTTGSQNTQARTTLETSGSPRRQGNLAGVERSKQLWRIKRNLESIRLIGKEKNLQTLKNLILKKADLSKRESILSKLDLSHTTSRDNSDIMLTGTD